MRLYLVQHGLAKSKEMDPERSLTEMGWVETKKVATLISTTHQIDVEKIFHSGKLRAKQTAEMFAQHLEISDKLEQANGLAPMDDPQIWVQKLENLDHDIMLVGHLPNLAKISSLLLSGNIDREIILFKNSGILCLKRNNTNDWSIEFYIIPQALL
jgi:phosphohistidine phosphatase